MIDGTPAYDTRIVVPVKRFMLIEQCPSTWQYLDLYVFRDRELVFYAGQSQLAFDRVWQHLRDGFKGRSVVGRFILCNWPASLNFQIELTSSQAKRFVSVDHDLDLAERELIREMAPCFNDALNTQPTPLPKRYVGLDAPLRCSRSLKKLIYEAQRAVKAEERQRWTSPTE